MSYESRYHVLLWDGEGHHEDPLYAARGLFVSHVAACGATQREVVDQFEAEVQHYPAGKYRLYPAGTVIDLTVKALVVVATPTS